MEKSGLLKKLKRKEELCRQRIKEYYFLTGGGVAGLVYGAYILHSFIMTAGTGFAILGGIGLYTSYKERRENKNRISELEQKLET